MKPIIALILLCLSATAAPVIRWDFSSEEATVVTAHGDVQRDQPGPRAPEFPDFDDANLAVHLDGKGSYLNIEDDGAGSHFDFTNGDTITLEAWIKLDDARVGSPLYIIGKGRTGSPRFPRDNQNWALRIIRTENTAAISFLFATPTGSGDAHWHRWTSEASFNVAGWHHIAAAYQFGTPASVRGWIDGKPTGGKWDMGGETKEAPVVDDDSIRIGSANLGNSLSGWVDAVAIHREIVDDATMAKRYNRVGAPLKEGPQAEMMPIVAGVPAGSVQVSFGEGLPSHTRWLNAGENWPADAARWAGDSFLLPRIPLCYDETGIRDAWKPAMLVRMVADVKLPVGEQQLLLRARGLARLWVDGKAVARTMAHTASGADGGEPITPVPEPPLPGLHARADGQQEVFGTVLGTGTSVRVVLEVIVGGKERRMESGEVCVALRSEDGKLYSVLRPDGLPALPLTELAIIPETRRIEASLRRFDDERRRAAAASADAFWATRHDIAREWATQHPAPDVPAGKTGSSNPVDAFVESKIERAVATAAASDLAVARQFHQEVLPILREECFRCHGEKSKGGLKLNSREAALKAGESEAHAVVPGKPDHSELILRVLSEDEDERMPPKGKGLDAKQVGLLKEWIEDGALWPPVPIDPAAVALAPITTDSAFIRRVSLDTIGIPPTAAETVAFLADTAPDKRSRLIDALLADERTADNDVSTWLDLLAENPTLINASLNSTGPFRWFLYDALRDNKPLDRMVTELIEMRGSAAFGGSAGFALAGENDAPFAAKGHILAAAFQAVELQCARCHDSPYHSTTQRDLYSLAAMLERKSVKVPATSRVPAAFFEKKQRESLIRVTLKPDEPVTPVWPFAKASGIDDSPDIDKLMAKPKDSRERLAALITSPANARFASVMVNRIWKRLMGAGIVEPVSDWEGRDASHPELLAWLANELVTHHYDTRHIKRLIMNSAAYQREGIGHNLEAAADQRYFNAPERRRMTAEQVVDALHASTGAAMNVEDLTFVHDGRRTMDKRQDLGKPNRAWMLVSLNNERDRPSLALPYAQSVVNVLEAFGWNGSRQQPISERESAPNVLQSGALANGTLSMAVNRASDGSALADLAVSAQSPDALTDSLFLMILSRHPKAAELAAFSHALADGFDTRIVPPEQVRPPETLPPLPQVSWFNHLSAEANTIQVQIEGRVRQGPPPDPRLQTAWRELFEDAVWGLINDREFVWVP